MYDFYNQMANSIRTVSEVIDKHTSIECFSSFGEIIQIIDKVQDPKECNKNECEATQFYNTMQPMDISLNDEKDIIIQSINSEINVLDESIEEENTYTDNSLCKEDTFFSENKIFELARYSWNSDSRKQLFTKGCWWSPDGTCILVPTNLDGMHLMELPSDLYDNGKISNKRSVTNLETVVHVKEGGTIYDVNWYPFMNSSAPETCCWIATRQHEPIHLWDAFNGDLRCSYKGFNAVDEVESAIAVTFSNDGEHVIGGYKTTIRIFNTDIPGRKCQSIANKQSASCFALNLTSKDLIATGNWNGVINIFDVRVSNLGCLSALFGHNSGVTHLKFSENPYTLFSGARKDRNILQWDMRNFSKPLKELQRNSITNQRIYFDLSPESVWLASGDKDGLLRVWSSQDNFASEKQFDLHGDSTNGINFHPNLPVMATSSGQYHFPSKDDTYPNEITYENSLIFWWIAATE